MICLKIRTFVVSATTLSNWSWAEVTLWFAWKFVPLWYQQQLQSYQGSCYCVVICLKIRTFVVSATTYKATKEVALTLWFAWKFVPLWYQQQQYGYMFPAPHGCDLLENSYLCGISNNYCPDTNASNAVVICLKIRTFVVSATTFIVLNDEMTRCDLLENSYLCGISNNHIARVHGRCRVVICLKIRTFVVSATTIVQIPMHQTRLWFAWKFVPLWYQQQLYSI